jgi:hypothetical protein
MGEISQPSAWCFLPFSSSSSRSDNPSHSTKQRCLNTRPCHSMKTVLLVVKWNLINNQSKVWRSKIRQNRSSRQVCYPYTCTLLNFNRIIQHGCELQAYLSPLVGALLKPVQLALAPC